MKAHPRGNALFTALIWLAAFSLLLGLWSPVGSAQQGASGLPDGDGASLATVTYASGAVGVWRDGATEWTMVDGSEALFMGDFVRTGAEARAVIVFADDSEVLMHEQTTMQIAPRAPVDEPRGVAARIKVSAGKIFNRITPEQSDLEFETPDAVAAVRGTVFQIGIHGLASDVANHALLLDQLRRPASVDETGAFLHDYLAWLAQTEQIEPPLRDTIQEVVTVAIGGMKLQDMNVAGADSEPAGQAYVQILDALLQQRESLHESAEDIVPRPTNIGDREGQLRNLVAAVAATAAASRTHPSDIADVLEQMRDSAADASDVSSAERQQQIREQLQQQRTALRDGMQARASAERERGPAVASRIGTDELIDLFLAAASGADGAPSPAEDWVVEYLDREMARRTGMDRGDFQPGSPPPFDFEQARQLAESLGVDAATVVMVLEGRVEVGNALGLVSVGAGEQTRATQAEVPEEPIEASQEAIQEATEWVDELEEELRTATAAQQQRGEQSESPAPDSDADEDVPVFVPGGVLPNSRGDGNGDRDPDPEVFTVRGRLMGGERPAPGRFVALFSSDPRASIHSEQRGSDTPVLDDPGRGEIGDAVLPGVERNAVTDAQGYYTFEVEPGTYWVFVGEIPVVKQGFPPVAPRAGDVFSWISAPVRVDETSVDMGDFQLHIGHDVLFGLTLQHSWWGVSEQEIQAFFPGGTTAGEDTFIVHLEDTIDDLNPIYVDWSFSGKLYEYAVNAAETSVLAGTEGELHTIHYVGEESDSLNQVRFTDWPYQLGADPARLLLEIVQEDGESLWLLGPKIARRGFPEVDAIEPVHAVYGANEAGLKVTLHGSNLDTVGTIRPRFRFDDAWSLPTSDPTTEAFTGVANAWGDELTFTIPWAELPRYQEQGPAAGFYGFELFAGQNESHSFGPGDPTNMDTPMLLVTSTDVSGNGPGAIPERGDLHRSAVGHGPTGKQDDLRLQEWLPPGNFIPSGPLQFVGSHTLVPSWWGDMLIVFSIEGDWQHQFESLTASEGEGMPFTVGSTMNGAQNHVFFEETGTDRADGLVSKSVATGEGHPLYNGWMRPQAMLAHEGVLVVGGFDEWTEAFHLFSFDAGAGTTDLAKSAPMEGVGYYSWSRLAVSTPIDGPPLVHVVSEGQIWTDELYTLQRRWTHEIADSGIVEFAIGPDGHTIYVVSTDKSRRPDSVSIRAIDTRTGAEQWIKNLSVPGDVRGWGVTENGLAVNPQTGEVYLLTWAIVRAKEAGNRNTLQTRIHVFDPNGRLTMIEVGVDDNFSWDDSDLMATHISGGLAFDANTSYLYGLATPAGHFDRGDLSGTQLFRADAAALRAGEEDIELELLTDLLPHGMDVVAMQLAHGYVWLLTSDAYGEMYSIHRMGGLHMADGALVDPPLDKRADKPTAQIGDVVTYTITFDNTKRVDEEEDIIDQLNVWIQDVLPPGFSFVEGSAYVYPSGVGGGSPVAVAPAPSSSGRTLQFELTDAATGGFIPEDTVRTLTYQAIVGPSVIEGAVYTNEAIGYRDGANTTQGVLDEDNLCVPATDPITNLSVLPSEDCDFILTNKTRADVRIVPGVFTMRGLVVGKVFHDTDGDGMQSRGEPGIPHVRIIMETGVSVVTDSFGKFSLGNLTPGLHVLMLDETTLPRADGGATTDRNTSLHVVGGPHRLLDLAGGGLFTVNFPVQGELLEQEDRSAEFDGPGAD